MKIQLEEISSAADSSLRIMVNPNLSDFFFWHFHPELELVFIEGANGTRHVGEHISTFMGSDLVLIGSNIPHLNFDYGIKSSYEKIVVHLRGDFLQTALTITPELADIGELFHRSSYGISFDESTKRLLAGTIKTLHTLDPFPRFLEMLRIFQVLANAPGQTLLHTHPVENFSSIREKERLKSIYQFINANYQRKITLDEIASHSNLTREAFCRYFKKMTRLTFTEFVNHFRIDVAKKLLLQGTNITQTCYNCGFDSISYFNRVFKRVTGVNPLAYKKRHIPHIMSRP